MVSIREVFVVLIQLTLVVSMLSGRISALAKAWTIASSSAALQTTYTMNPRRSMSRDRDFVRGRVGDPAMTTTSVRPPLRALFALLTFLQL